MPAKHHDVVIRPYSKEGGCQTDEGVAEVDGTRSGDQHRHTTSNTSVVDVSFDEGGVTVVQDTYTYTALLHSNKSKDARWVQGLSPEDDERGSSTSEETYAEVSWGTRQNAYTASHQSLCQRISSPNMWCCLYVMVLVGLCISGWDGGGSMNFPSTEETLWEHCKGEQEGFVDFAKRVVIPLACPSCVGALYGIFLSFRIGSATHDFTALCGIGTAVLSILAWLCQVVLLAAACKISSISKQRECSVPFVLFHLCSTIRVGSPLLSVWSVAPVMDSVSGYGTHWRYMLAIPVILWAVATAILIYEGSPLYVLYRCVHYATVPCWATFGYLYSNQRYFSDVECGDKLHTD